MLLKEILTVLPRRRQKNPTRLIAPMAARPLPRPVPPQTWTVRAAFHSENILPAGGPVKRHREA